MAEKKRELKRALGGKVNLTTENLIPSGMYGVVGYDAEADVYELVAICPLEAHADTVAEGLIRMRMSENARHGQGIRRVKTGTLFERFTIINDEGRVVRAYVQDDPGDPDNI